ncbi:hypothetical protein M8997_004010 [Phyllobacterium sp. 21LDTY02-6]|uniref:DnaT-like ssDNA-binding protein n=1 Tax=Phyllobacterium sp. 21LDTY02-6 TaxID=2944903 RepID=UPI002021D43F|nr:DnaT-like ssDNA-binding protein [Phyllobacterium sp. 21LDTY02-6]MCO4316337.1 hypothetical protein [Phyllobacterium sp. 21LDTY02-6]
MALTTTPGAVDVDSYADVAAFKTYAGNMGYDIADKTDPEIEQALRRGTRWIDATYGARFVGSPTDSAQALEWPRTGAKWRGSELPDDVIPSQVKNATSEAAWRELTAPGSLSPDYNGADQIKRERKKVGELEKEIEYADGSFSQAASVPVFSVIDGILSSLIGAKQSNLFGSAARA